MGGRVVREERQNPTSLAFETWKTVEYEPGSNNIAAVVDGEGRRTTYEYNGFGRLKKVNYGVPPGGGAALFSESFEYDPSGNVTNHVTRTGETIGMWYDARSRLVWRAQTSGAAGAGKARTQSLSYDQLGNLVGVGTLDDEQFCYHWGQSPKCVAYNGAPAHTLRTDPG